MRGCTDWAICDECSNFGEDADHQGDAVALKKRRAPMMWTLRRRRPCAPRRRRPQLRSNLAVVGLEDRVLLAVTNLNTGFAFVTIQEAVDAANPENFLLADAGTYNETVTIDKPLTIRGAQFGVDART